MISEAIRTAERHWMRRERRRHVLYAVAHAGAALVACYVLAASVPAACWHGREAM